MSTDYNINKGINRPIEFKGLKAQYILYLAAGLLALLMLFAILYLIGLSVYLILPLIGILGSALFYYVTRFSKKYGAHGLMKAAGYRRVPKTLRGKRINIIKENKKD